MRLLLLVTLALLMHSQFALGQALSSNDPSLWETGVTVSGLDDVADPVVISKFRGSWVVVGILSRASMVESSSSSVRSMVVVSLRFPPDKLPQFLSRVYGATEFGMRGRDGQQVYLSEMYLEMLSLVVSDTSGTASVTFSLPSGQIPTGSN